VTPARTFDKESPVTAYWLTRCEGFRVSSGRRRGEVESVVLDLETWRAAYLVVRYRGLGRRRIVPPGAVDAVVPAEQRLVLRSRGRLDGGETAIARVGRWAVLALSHTASALAEVARRAVPVLSRGGSALARGTRGAAVSAGLAAVVLAHAAQVLATRAAARSTSRGRPPTFEHRPARR
jgi:hypothetical protein